MQKVNVCMAQITNNVGKMVAPLLIMNDERFFAPEERFFAPEERFFAPEERFFAPEE